MHVAVQVSRVHVLRRVLVLVMVSHYTVSSRVLGGPLLAHSTGTVCVPLPLEGQHSVRVAVRADAQSCDHSQYRKGAARRSLTSTPRASLSPTMRLQYVAERWLNARLRSKSSQTHAALVCGRFSPPAAWPCRAYACSTASLRQQLLQLTNSIGAAQPLGRACHSPTYMGPLC